MSYPKSCYLKVGLVGWAMRFLRLKLMRLDLSVTSFDNFG